MITAIASQQFSQWMIWIYHASIVGRTSDLGNRIRKKGCVHIANMREIGLGKSAVAIDACLALTIRQHGVASSDCPFAVRRTSDSERWLVGSRHRCREAVSSK